MATELSDDYSLIWVHLSLANSVVLNLKNFTMIQEIYFFFLPGTLMLLL